MKNKSDEILKEYSQAIEANANTVVSKTGNARFAKYSAEELSKFPENIEEHSFGCGNPLSFSNVRQGDTVLDLGCGAGLDLLIAAEKVGETGRVIGLDFNEDMLSLAKKKVRDYPNIELRHGRIEELPIDSNSVDWVISNCVINLSEKKQRAFNEIWRVLKPNGKMIVSDIVAENLPWWVRRSGVLKAACGGGVISEEKYLKGLRKAGLQKTKIVARQYYEASQLASIVSDAAPQVIRNIWCCGRPLLHTVLVKFATPISKNLWSAKISATAYKV